MANIRKKFKGVSGQLACVAKAFNGLHTQMVILMVIKRRSECYSYIQIPSFILHAPDMSRRSSSHISLVTRSTSGTWRRLTSSRAQNIAKNRLYVNCAILGILVTEVVFQGYLAVTLLMHENSDFLRLVVNSIRKDLDEASEISNCLALHAIANVGGSEMAEALSEDVHRLLISP
jgi:hypothetical protein